MRSVYSAGRRDENLRRSRARGRLEPMRAYILIAVGTTVLLALAGWSVHSWQAARALADRDFAACGLRTDAPGCSERVLLVTTSWSRSASDAFRKRYTISVQTGGHSFFSVGGVSARQAAVFAASQTARARYHDGRLTALVATDGEVLKVPFAFSRQLLVDAGVGLLLFLLGGLALTFGLIGWSRSRSEPPA